MGQLVRQQSWGIELHIFKTVFKLVWEYVSTLCITVLQCSNVSSSRSSFLEDIKT